MDAGIAGTPRGMIREAVSQYFTAYTKAERLSTARAEKDIENAIAEGVLRVFALYSGKKEWYNMDYYNDIREGRQDEISRKLL